jgi:hypothetical protein
MHDDTSNTLAEAGNTETPPPSSVRPARLQGAVRWAWRLQGAAGDLEDIFDAVCHALGRGDAGCITLRLSSRSYRLSPVQDFRALTEIDPHGGRVRLRTRDLLPRHTFPDYPAALLAFAAQFGLGAEYMWPNQIIERLYRAGIRLPPHLSDNGSCLPPFALAAQLGMQFTLGVDEEEAAAILHKLDDRRVAFDISRDWIVSEVRAICRRTGRAAAREPHRIIVQHERQEHVGEIQHVVRGDIGLQHTGRPRKQRKPGEAQKKPGRGTPHAHLNPCRDALLEALRTSKCSSDTALSYLRDTILPKLQKESPNIEPAEVRWEERVAEWAREKWAKERKI